MPGRKTLEDLFSETLKDICFAEKQILRALPSNITKSPATVLSKHGLRSSAQHVAKLLDATLQEEIQTDQLLTKIEASTITMKAKAA